MGVGMDEGKPKETITGVLLAGGSARRMGGCDKCLLPIDERPMLDHIIARARPQVDHLLLNTNSDAALFHRYDIPVIKDTVAGLAGPLAGLLAAMEWMQLQPAEGGVGKWLASFPTDSPFFPRDLVERLLKAARADHAELAIAVGKNGRSPLFALWSVDLREALSNALKQKAYRVGNFVDSRRWVAVEFPTEAYDPFFNINTVEDLKTAREIVEAHPALLATPLA